MNWIISLLIDLIYKMSETNMQFIITDGEERG